MFQPTHPHGVRPIAFSMKKRRGGFNPRTRTGCDILYPPLRFPRRSQPRPHGATARFYLRAPPSGFQPRPHGATPLTHYQQQQCVSSPHRTGAADLGRPGGGSPGFNPRTRTVRLINRMFRMVRGVSTHAPRGATQCNHGKTMFILVQPHPHGVRRSTRDGSQAVAVSTHAPARVRR